jgi:hypothetical protein
MKVPAIISCAVMGTALLLAPLAQAHHSNSAFFVDKVITIKGVVEWKVEGRPPGILGRAGWTPKSLQPGDIITVDLSPAKDDTASGLIARVTKADGTILANAPPPTE